MTECDLGNASYSVDFNFKYPELKHSVHMTEWVNMVMAYTPSRELVDAEENSILSYCAVMDAFGKTLVGRSLHNNRYSGTSESFTSRSMMKIDLDREEPVRTGLEQLFQNITLSLLSDGGLMQVVIFPL